jgi:outer membrane receptor protein involved in Fe transport
MAQSTASHRLAAAVSAALGFVAPGGSPRAQPVPPDDQPLETIVVTASRREVDVQDIPFNIVALGADAIDELRITDLNTFSRAVPGLYVSYQGPRGANLMTVRGLNVDSLNASESLGNGTGGTVATYLGDIPLYVDLQMLDIERVEALLGPQGTLYGVGTLAGAIRYLPNRPDPSRWESEVGGRLYSIEQSDGTGYDVRGMLNVPLVEDRLALRIVAGYLDDPGFVDYDYVVQVPGVSNPQPDYGDPADVAANLRSVEDSDTEETFSGRVGLFWQATDALAANLTYYYQDQQVGARTVNHDKAFDTGRYVSGHRFLEPNDITNDLLALEIVWDLGFADLTSATGWSDFESSGQRDQTDLLLDFEYGYEFFPSFAAYTKDTSDETTFSQELRLVSKVEGRWNWIAGAFYNSFDFDARSEEHTPGYPEWAFGDPTIPDLEYLQLSKEIYDEYALFGEIGYRVAERWQVTLGGRWWDFNDDLKIQTAVPFFPGDDPDGNPYPPGTVVLGGDRNETSDNDFIFKFNASYDVNDDVMTYLTISEGYRRGGVNSGAECETPLPPGQNVCLLPDEVLIKPDKTTNYELGLRSAWLGGTLILNGAVYYIVWNDVQVAGATVNGDQQIVVNGGSALSKGIELTMRWSATSWLEFAANASFNDAHLTSYAPGLVDDVDAYAGDRLSGSPEQQGALLVAVTQPLRDGWQFEADYTLYAVGDVYTKVGLRDNGEILPGYAVSGLSFGVTNDRWTARLYADNLFDKYAVTSVRRDPSYIRQVGLFDSRRYFEAMLRPRTIGLELNYRFGM